MADENGGAPPTPNPESYLLPAKRCGYLFLIRFDLTQDRSIIISRLRPYHLYKMLKHELHDGTSMEEPTTNFLMQTLDTPTARDGFTPVYPPVNSPTTSRVRVSLYISQWHKSYLTLFLGIG